MAARRATQQLALHRDRYQPSLLIYSLRFHEREREREGWGLTYRWSRSWSGRRSSDRWDDGSKSHHRGVARRGKAYRRRRASRFRCRRASRRTWRWRRIRRHVRRCVGQQGKEQDRGTKAWRRRPLEGDGKLVQLLVGRRVGVHTSPSSHSTTKLEATDKWFPVTFDWERKTEKGVRGTHPISYWLDQ